MAEPAISDLPASVGSASGVPPEAAALPDPPAETRPLAAETLRLYRADWVVLRRNGYANAGITEILGEAGLGTRAFYRHFDSKDELLVSMFAENASATARRLADHVEDVGRGPARGPHAVARPEHRGQHR